MTEETATEAPAKGKSIVDPKYRDKYKSVAKDFVAQGLADHGSATKTVKTKEGEKEVERTVVTGVDIEKLFQIAGDNNLDVKKYRAQVGGHGFAGRFRMTLANMLRAAAKQRHGLYFGGNWVEAPESWLRIHGAPEKPTHDKDGTKFKVEKPVKEQAAEPPIQKPVMTDEERAALRANVAKGREGKKK